MLQGRLASGAALVPDGAAIDPAALQARLAQALDPRRWVILMMGDPESALGPLRAEDVGRVEIVR